MGEVILDGIGSGFKAGVTSSNRLMVDSLATVTTGSESFGFGKSGTSWVAIKVDSDGTLNTNASVTTGSESFIFGKSGTNWIATRVDANGVLDTNATFTGSIQIYDPKGIGSSLITNPSVVGSLSIQTIIGTISGIQATNPWIILGSVNVDNAVSIGSLAVQTINGSLAIVEQTPTASTQINFATQLIYSGTVIGSLVKHNPAGGSFVQVLTYDGSDNLTNVGSWT